MDISIIIQYHYNITTTFGSQFGVFDLPLTFDRLVAKN